jgi:hypothetical protein
MAMENTSPGCKRLVYAFTFGVFFTLAATVISFETGLERLASVLLWPAALVHSVLEPRPNIHNFSPAVPISLVVAAVFYSILAYLFLRLIKR